MAERDPRPVGDLVVELFRRKGFMRSLRRAEAVLLWPRVVGEEVARFSSARTLNDGVLTVDVGDSETAMHLSMQRRRFLARYHDTYAVNDVKEIRFQVGRVVGGAPGAAAKGGMRGSAAGSEGHPAGPAAEPRAVAAMARDLERLDLPDELGAAVRLAGRSLLDMRARQEAAGYSACPTCGAYHDGLSAALTPREETLLSRQPAHPQLRERELCPGCRRSLHEPRVKDEARRLALAPGASDPTLSDAEAAVAKRIATAYLDAALRDLLPRAIAQPGLRAQLELVARCRCALAVGKTDAELDDDDLEVLDAGVVRFLGGSWSGS